MSWLYYFRCNCGAITVHTDKGDYSCYWGNRNKCFPGLDLRKLPRVEDTRYCGHCSHHHGLDLCGCGSGNLFGYCDNALPECGVPMQKLGEYTRVKAENVLAE